MIKKILLLLALVLTAAYLVVAVTVLNGDPVKVVCKGMELTVRDNFEYGLVTQKDIDALLKRKKMYPVGKSADEVNVRAIEDTVAAHPFVKSAQCYLTTGGTVKLDIYQRIPLLRVMTNEGGDYFIDSEGEILATAGRPVHVAVATGYIDENFARTQLYELAQYIHGDKFWEAQIEQVVVTARKEIELIPRVGSHVLFLGKPGGYNEKFTKLRTFYEKALNEVGWNKYERISIEFTNQIICKKKDK